MKIFIIGGLEEGYEAFHNKALAIKTAKDYALPDLYVDELDLGKVDRETVRRLVEGRGYVARSRSVWPTVTDWR